MSKEAVFQAARRAIYALSGAKRMCAEVHPVMHKVKQTKKVDGKPKTRHVTKQTGTFLVKLFEGGTLTFDSDEEAARVHSDVSLAMRTLVREATKSDRKVITDVMDADGTLHYALELQQALDRLEGAEALGLHCAGPNLVPYPNGVVTVSGEGAAEWLANSINKALKPYVDRCYKAAYEQLTEVTKQL